MIRQHRLRFFDGALLHLATAHGAIVQTVRRYKHLAAWILRNTPDGRYGGDRHEGDIAAQQLMQFFVEFKHSVPRRLGVSAPGLSSFTRLRTCPSGFASRRRGAHLSQLTIATVWPTNHSRSSGAACFAVSAGFARELKVCNTIEDFLV